MEVALRSPLLLPAPLAPGGSTELIELFTHHGFSHDPNGALGETTQVLMEDWLFREDRGGWF